jgi:hypothetical protein
MSELPPKCDFCDRNLDEDEELKSVFIGEPPEPETVGAYATAKKQRKVIGRQTENSQLGGSSTVQVLGRPVGEIEALLKALDGSDVFTVNASQSVVEVNHNEEELRKMKTNPNHIPSFEETENTDKVAVEIEAKPEPCKRSPDLEVCEFCVESFRQEGER